MGNYKIQRMIKVDPSPRELAEVFASWTSDKQADFFSWISIAVGDWGTDFAFQLQRVTDDDLLTQGGRDIMRQIGEYSEDTRKERKA